MPFCTSTLVGPALLADQLSACPVVSGFVLLGAAFDKKLSLAAVVFGWGLAEFGILIVTVSVYAYLMNCFPSHRGETSALINFARVLGGFAVVSVSLSLSILYPQLKLTVLANPTALLPSALLARKLADGRIRDGGWSRIRPFHRDRSDFADLRSSTSSSILRPPPIGTISSRRSVPIFPLPALSQYHSYQTLSYLFSLSSLSITCFSRYLDR